MAIQVRRGLYVNLDPNKLLTGEFAVSTDKKVLHIAFAPGVVEQLITYQNMKDEIAQATAEITSSLTTNVNTAVTNANTATSQANTARDNANAKALLAEQKAQLAQSVVDSASPIINTNLQATYANKATDLTAPFINSTLADSGYAEVFVQGKSTQTVTTQEKNLIDVTKQCGLSFASDMILQSGASNILSVIVKVLPSTTYILSKNVVGARFRVLETSAYPVTGATGTKINSADTSTVLKFTTSATTNYLVVYYGYTTDGITQIQLEQNTEVTPYDTFVPNSPSADYPSAITSVGDIAFDVWDSGVNILKSEAVSTEMGGVTYAVNSDGSITASGTRTASSYINILGKVATSWATTVFIFKKGITYYAPLNNVSYKKKDGTYTSIQKGNSLTPTEDIECYAIYFEVSSTMTLPLTAYPFITVNSGITTFTQYRGDKINITTPYRSLPNGVKDEDVVVDGVKYKVQRVGKVVLNGSETYTQRNTGDGTNTISFNLYGLGIVTSATSSQIMCSHFISSGSSTDGKENVGSGGSNELYIEINRARLSTVDITGFKAWLVNNPVTVLYELATPIYTALTRTTLLETKKGTVNIGTTSPVQGDIRVNLLSQLESMRIKHEALIKTKYDSSTAVEFTEASADTDIVSGENIPTIFGKILKSIKTLRTSLASKINTSAIVNNLTSGGSTSVASAETVKVLNTGKADKSTSVSITLSSASWSSGAYVISNANITASNIVEIMFASGATTTVVNAWTKAKIVRYVQAVGSITLYADGIVPTSNIPITMIIRGDL